MTSLLSTLSVSSQQPVPTGTVNTAPQQPPFSTSLLSPSSSIAPSSSSVMPTLLSDSGVSSTLPSPPSTVTIPEITVTIPVMTVTVPLTTTSSKQRSFPPARSVPTIIPTPLGSTGAAPVPNGPSSPTTSETPGTLSASILTSTSTPSLPLETYLLLTRVGRPFSG
ncbi:hypothetical protein B0T20DRAFT_80917 [Sordaria brevicollis]|uniref:Uncharacterized protein n=1 Tax=Sordaria brevicollis TaxID=83679 RepID=A0AAE0P1J2_SORBR|nr:hypothetical protein B0T20DRAFT_80917 [Sordaria brevicollis]